MAAALASFVAAPALAGERVDLQLVLAVDVSSSVDGEEYELQMRGLSDAFRHPDVVGAIRMAGGAGLAVALMQWSDDGSQALSVGWSPVYDAESAAGLAALIRRAPRAIAGGQTAIGSALQYAVALFESSPFDSRRRTIDISGDGRANSGAHPIAVRERALAQGITINGLAIRNEEPFVDSYYLHSVIGGPDAFLETAEDYEDFASAILKKLIREIGVPLAEAPCGRRRYGMTISPPQRS